MNHWKGLQTLRELTNDNLIQQVRVNQLETLIKNRGIFLKQLFLAYTSQNDQTALQLAGEKNQLAQRAEILQLFAGFILEERDLLKQREITFDQRFQESNFLFILAAIFSEILFVMILVLLNYYLIKRARAENKNKESEERLRLIIDNAKDYAIITLNPEGLVTTWSLGAERIKGYKKEEIIGKPFSCFYPQEEIDDKLPLQKLKITKEQGTK